jgi:hypothetical protein
MKVMLIGCGYMSFEYSRVLNELNVPYSIFVRNTNSNNLKKYEFKEQIICLSKLNKLNLELYTHAIIATSVNSLKQNTINIAKRIKFILVEKPLVFSVRELDYICEKTINTQIFIAFNRRFYSNVIQLKKVLKNKKIIHSELEFNERRSIIKNTLHAKKVFNNWVQANASHVIDLYFYITNFEIKNFKIYKKFIHGKPIQKSIWFIKEKNKNNFIHANWSKDGSWKLKFYTDDGYFYLLDPIETLITSNSKKINIITTKDTKFKFGLKEQVLSFLNNKSQLLNINKYRSLVKFLEKINR